MTDETLTATPAQAGVNAPLTEAKRAFAAAGGKLQHKAVADALANAETRARSEAVTAGQPRNARVARFVNDALGWLGMTFVVVALVIGVLLALIILPAAEYASVYKGLSVVTQDATIVTLTTLALLLAVVVLPFLKHAYADALPDGKKPRTRSLAQRAFDVLVFIGVVKPRPASAADAGTLVEANYLLVSAAYGFTKVTVLLASALGRLGAPLEKYGSLPLGEALREVQAQLTAQELLGLVASVLTLFAIIIVLDVLTLLVYVSFKNTAGRLELGKDEASAGVVSFEHLRDAYQIEVLNDLTITLEAQAQKRLPSPSSAPSPTLSHDAPPSAPPSAAETTV